MDIKDQQSTVGGRTYLAGKIVSSFGQSLIDCVIRRMSDDGATIEIESVFGVPEHFLLLVAKQRIPRPCKRIWQSDKQIGLKFEISIQENNRLLSTRTQNENGAI